VPQLQAACGFSAFAEFRLLSRGLDTGEPGFDAGESGNFVHRVLASFWQQTRSQQALAQLTVEQRRERLSLAVDAALDSRVRPSSDWDKAYVAVQKERLVRLLQQWLDFELKRGPFEVVEAEKEQYFPIGPLDLKLRIDRLDKVEGGVFLVDYKTGASASRSDWYDQRPDEPQLPLYALIPAADQLKGMAFAKIRAGKEMKWSGIEADPGYLANTGPASRNVVDLPQQIAEWRATLESLAQAFWDGDASVSPKSYPRTCTHCAQRLLCRLVPASLLENADTVEEDEAYSVGGHDG
jgi:RecB family exonuclease